MLRNSSCGPDTNSYAISDKNISRDERDFSDGSVSGVYVRYFSTKYRVLYPNSSAGQLRRPRGTKVIAWVYVLEAFRTFCGNRRVSPRHVPVIVPWYYDRTSCRSVRLGVLVIPADIMGDRLMANGLNFLVASRKICTARRIYVVLIRGENSNFRLTICSNTTFEVTFVAPL
jgi:hypothetical protein